MATILIVEDDAQVREMLSETLQEEGYDILEAVDGVDGLEQCETHSPDLVITDIMMPRKEGLSLITELRRKRPETSVIAISGGAPDLKAGCNLELAKLFGAQCVFQKPLDIDALLATIAAMLIHNPADD